MNVIIFFLILSIHRALFSLEVTPQIKDAIHKGLEYLAANQREIQAQEEYFYGRENNARTSKFSFIGLAYLATGSTFSSGLYAEKLREILSHILKNQNPQTGFLGVQGPGRPMFGHALSVLFLSQCAGMGQTPKENFEIRRALKEGVDFIIRAQHEEGWWGYVPRPQESAITDEGSITVFQVEALRAAKDVGIFVPKEVIDKAVSFLKKTQNPDGGLRYKFKIRNAARDHDTKSRLSISAAGLCIFMAAGEYDSAPFKSLKSFVIEQALKQKLSIKDEKLKEEDEKHFFFYTILYLSRAIFKLDDVDSRKILDKIRDELLRSQEPDGSWSSRYGCTYATSIAILVLSMPYEYSSYMIR